MVAGMTKKVRLGTGVLQAALRRPIVLAKTCATLDKLSGGRLDLGIGVGWQREEYEAAGLDFARRGQLLDHTLEVCARLWSEQRAAYDGEGVRFEGIHLMPKPWRPGGVPVWVSGTLNERVLRRVARYGAGWIPWGPELADLASAVPRLRDGVAALGRDPGEIGVVGSVMPVTGAGGGIDAHATMAGVPALVALGVTDVRLFLPVPDSNGALADQLGPLAGAFRAIVPVASDAASP
jgi:probable F420-dependent oxidoreductase